MADDESELDPPQEYLDNVEDGTGTEGEGAEGQDQGDGDDQGDLSAEQLDASTEDDQRSQGLDQAEGALERPPQSRAQRRIAATAAENARLREELARLQGSMTAEQRFQQQERQRQMEWERQQRRAVMTPEEAYADQFQERVNSLEQQIQFGRSWLVNETDRIRFESKAASNPTYARYANEVEQMFQSEAQQGRIWQRERILKYILGERALASAERQGPKAKQRGAKKVEDARTRPGSPRGDAATTRGRGQSSPESRLKDVPL